MADALTLGSMSPELTKVADRAKREPGAVFHSLAHLITVSALTRAYGRQRKDAGVGVDGITKEKYGEELEKNLQDLHGRLKTGRYRHQPIRRVHIPKEPGKTRPIGISCFEDKLVQEVVREVMEAIYEREFVDNSFGFRPKRNAHDAIRALNRAVYRGEVNWVLEADFKSYFDSVDRARLTGMLQVKIADGSLLRLIGKCLNVGVLDGEEFSSPEVGTAQGSVLSPLLGNIYLHYVLDLWFEREVQPGLRGKATLIRYADDFVICFETREDAEKVMATLEVRMVQHGLTLHPDKTRLLPFGRPSKGQTSGKGPATFDFLGFTAYWRRTRRGRWEMALKTRRARLARASQAVYDWCRRYRHLPVKEQHTALVRRIRGHNLYFGVNGNTRSLARLVNQAERAWHKWLNRRSQKSRLTWERFKRMMEDFPLPKPLVAVQVWGK
jgi:group II intron reverse transcriptase/maturase